MNQCDKAGSCFCDEGTCRISELEAEVGRLNALIESGRRCNDEYAMQKITLNHLIEASEAKLAAIQKTTKFMHRASDSKDDFEYVKWADIRAILRREDT